MSRIHVISGLQAAGKSTVADLLARGFPRGVHVAGDAVRAMVVSGRLDMAPDNSDGALKQFLACYEASVAVAAVYDAAGSALDGLTARSQHDEVDSWPRQQPQEPDGRRAVDDVRQQRSKSSYGKNWSVDGLAEVLEQDTPVFGRWLDTSDLTPEQTVDRILAEPDSSLIQVHDVLDRHRLASDADTAP